MSLETIVTIIASLAGAAGFVLALPGHRKSKLVAVAELLLLEQD